MTLASTDSVLKVFHSMKYIILVLGRNTTFWVATFSKIVETVLEIGWQLERSALVSCVRNFQSCVHSLTL